MKNILQSVKVATLAVALTIGLSYVYAWTVPTETPPNGNVLAPLNTSGTDQTKAGPSLLTLDGVSANVYLDQNDTNYFVNPNLDSVMKNVLVTTGDVCTGWDEVNHIPTASTKCLSTVGAGGGTPTGAIMPYAGATAPSGWLIADGSAVSRTTYSALYAVTGTTYGMGDGSTTFNLPNLKGNVPVGLDASQTEFTPIGKTGGEKAHTLTVAEMPSHTHTWGFHYVGDNHQRWSGGNQYYQDYGSTLPSNTGSAGGNQSHNNLEPYITLNYIIKI